jgi:lysine-N-methylase
LPDRAGSWRGGAAGCYKGAVAKAQRKTSLAIVYPEKQKFECRDCPARCCRSGWAIPVSPETAHFILQDEELKRRLIGRGPAILASGTLPMVERERLLQCVFLDDDLLCAVQKKHGHAAIPDACQAFPFGFMNDEEQRPVAQLSRYCPSIRDNYGKPVGDAVQVKLKQAGGSKPLAPRMGLKSGRTLPKEQYLQVAEVWRELLRDNPADAVMRAYEVTDRFDEELKPAAPSNEQVREALAAARAQKSAPLSRRKAGFSARLLFAHLFGSLTYPVRLLTDFAVRKPTLALRLRTGFIKLRWLLGLGRADLLHVPGSVPLGAIERVARFLDTPLAEPINAYLRELLDRRQPFARQTYLVRALVDLGFAVALISRYARARAAAAGLSQVREADVAEGIGIAELTLSHDAEQGMVMLQLRHQLMSDPNAFRKLLASEA